MKNRIAFLICFALVAACLAGCEGGKSGQATAVSAAAMGTVTAWIDAPLDQMTLPLAPYEVVYHASDPVEVRQIEFTVDGEVLAVDANPNPAEHLVTVRHTWNPPGPGNYTLRVRAMSAAGLWSDFAVANVTVAEDATPTSTPTITATATVTTTPTPSATPTETPTPTQDVLTFTPSLSTNQFYYGACSPTSVTLTVGVSQPERVSSVVVFFKFEDLESGQMTGWDAGTAMNPSADRQTYSRSVAAASIAGYNTYAKARVWYQFVATDSSGQIVGRSASYTDLTLARCGIFVVSTQPIQVQPQTPTPTDTPFVVINPWR